MALAAMLTAGALDSAPAQAPRRLSPVDLDGITVPAADVREPYGADTLQYGLLRIPDGAGPFPVAVVIHGGCWLAQIGGYRPTPAYMAPLADALRNAGVVTWNIEYRSLGHDGGGWPGTFLDVAAGIDHLRSVASRYPIDTTRIIAVGHSAGGHLALWAAARHRLNAASDLHTPAPLGLAGAVSLGGPGDLLDFARYDRSICREPIMARLLGVLPDTSIAALGPRAREASPAELLPLGIPHRLIVGVDDGVVPAAAAEAFVARARAAGDDARYVPVPDAGHFDPLSPATRGWSLVRQALLDLLRP